MCSYYYADLSGIKYSSSTVLDISQEPNILSGVNKSVNLS